MFAGAAPVCPIPAAPIAITSAHASTQSKILAIMESPYSLSS
jgi:hypothetical protein